MVHSLARCHKTHTSIHSISLKHKCSQPEVRLHWSHEDKLTVSFFKHLTDQWKRQTHQPSSNAVMERGTENVGTHWCWSQIHTANRSCTHLFSWSQLLPPQLRAGQSSKQVQERGPGSADRHDLTNTEDWFECTLHHMGAVCAKYLTSPSLSIFIVLPNMAWWENLQIAGYMPALRKIVQSSHYYLLPRAGTREIPNHSTKKRSWLLLPLLRLPAVTSFQQCCLG